MLGMNNKEIGVVNDFFFFLSCFKVFGENSMGRLFLNAFSDLGLKVVFIFPPRDLNGQGFSHCLFF